MEFEDYSIGIPDGFEARRDFDGRDFVMWKPKKLGTKYDENVDILDITESSVMVLQENNAVETDKAPDETIQKILFKETYDDLLARIDIAEAEAKLNACSTRQKRWEDAVAQACFDYEQQVKQYLEYISGKNRDNGETLSELDDVSEDDDMEPPVMPDADSIFD